MKDILLLITAGYVGWYLAINEKQATIDALEQAKIEIKKVKAELTDEIKTNDKLNTLLDGISIRKGFDGSEERPKQRPRPTQRPKPKPRG
jgi:hypothetical protein